jgi:hypothetical protein
MARRRDSAIQLTRLTGNGMFDLFSLIHILAIMAAFGPTSASR